MRVWMIGAEMAPFSKVGGLGDVLGALPDALLRHGVDITVFLPHLPSMDNQRWGITDTGLEVSAWVGGSAKVAKLLECRTSKGARVIFIQNADYFERENLYTSSGEGFYDNAQRFCFFNYAAIEAGKKIAPNPDIVHCHDWQAALAPFFLRAPEHYGAEMENVFLVQSIHNLSYQGVFNKNLLPDLGIDWKRFNYLELEFFDQINFLKAGLVFSDVVTTVSPTYANEIQTPEHSWGLEGVLREKGGSLFGILNGIDTELWDPATDEFIPSKFTEKNLAKKEPNKRALRTYFGLANSKKPLIGLVTRLVWQKGVDALLASAEKLVGMGFQIVCLGTGEKHYEEGMAALAQRFDQDIGVKIGYNEPLSRLIYAGSDFFLMPSLFEPCGIGQLLAMRYGTIPIVRRTGGLADTVIDVDEGGAGFVFNHPDAGGVTWAASRAMTAWEDNRVLGQLRKRNMAFDFSWDTSAEAYIELYKRGISMKNS